MSFTIDRCRPTFAVEFLERIKHYFGNDKVSFIMTVNKEQLIHTLAVYYGEGFDSSRYLNKFFDYEVVLPPIDVKGRFKKCRKINDYQNTVYNSVIFDILDHMPLSARDIGIFAEKTDKAFKIAYYYQEKQGYILQWILPILAYYQISDTKVFQQIMNGRGLEYFEQIMRQCPEIKRMLSLYPSNGSGDEDYDSAWTQFSLIYNDEFSGQQEWDKRHSWEQGSFKLKSTCLRCLGGLI